MVDAQFRSNRAQILILPLNWNDEVRPIRAFQIFKHVGVPRRAWLGKHLILADHAQTETAIDAISRDGTRPPGRPRIRVTAMAQDMRAPSRLSAFLVSADRRRMSGDEPRGAQSHV